MISDLLTIRFKTKCYHLLLFWSKNLKFDFMRKLILVFLFCFTAVFVFAQQTAYFDRTFHNKNNDSKRNNRRVYTVNDSLIQIKDYRKTDLFRVGYFYGFSDFENLDEYIYFMSNNDVDRSPKLITDSRAAVVKKWFRNIAIEQLWIEEEILYRQVWIDEQEMLVNGTGKFENCSSNLPEIGVTVIKDSLQVEGYIVRKQKRDTIYSMIDTNAYPKQGILKFYQELSETIDMDNISKKIEMEKDRIFISFIVDKNGQLTDFYILNDKGFKFSNKELKKLKSMPSWVPATFNGRYVKTRFFFTLTYQPDRIKHYFNVER